MATEQTAFAENAQAGFQKTQSEGVQVTADAQSSLPSSKSYKLVKSATGNNLYVEANEYDPLAHHRKGDKASNKGQGLGFMFCCFKQPQTVEEPMRYGYEVAPEPSALANKIE